MIHLFSLTKHRFILIQIVAFTCFGLYLGHPQSCQFKNRTNEDIKRI